MTNLSIDLSKNCDQLTVDCLEEISDQAKALNMDPDGNDRLTQAITRWLSGKKYEKAMKLLGNLKAGIPG